jgi:uncharacterized protein (TIGR02452 family)
MSLSGVAKETLKIVENCGYQSPGGARVELGEELTAAIAGTRLYRPADSDQLLSRPAAAVSADVARGAPARPRLEVTDESTAAAARRLVHEEGERHVVALNYASARNPGGGFLGGAKAQEEDLARCSALYSCLITQPDYYAINRAESSLLYTDHIIYSPDVPFFRDDRLDLLERPFLVSIITAPAPNAGEVQRKGDDIAHLDATLHRRAAKVLAVAEDRGHRTLVLGAWGCGVFRNDPARVAAVFAEWLTSPRFKGAFDRVVFGVYDKSRERATLDAFRRQFSA